jgi:hypothetical protein
MATPTYKNLDALVETPESGALEFGAVITLTKVYRAKYSVCLANAKDKGTVGSGATSGYLIASSKVTPERGGLGTLTDTWVVGGPDASPETMSLPPDEVSVRPSNLSPRVERHPRYVTLTAAQLELVEGALRAATADRATAYAALPTLGKNLVDKIRAGNESYYLAAVRYSWAAHSYSIPTATRGGYVEAIDGPLEGYFASGIEWLREADDLQYSNGIWRLTKTWQGSDAWDTELYPV